MLESIYQQYIITGKVSTDTRQIEPGAVFFALSGPHFDGNAFARKAFQEGASACVLSDAGLVKELEKEGFKVFLVEDTLKTLQALATYHRSRFQFPVIAITGSNGKTTTKELIWAVLSEHLDVLATKGNLNNHIGIPLTLLSWPIDLDVGIVEMGANHLHEIKSYCAIARPDYGLITNCGKAHLEGFGSEEGVIQAKTELYDYLREHQGKIFLHEELDYLKDRVQGLNVAFTYGAHQGLVQGTIVQEQPLTIQLKSPVSELIVAQLFGGYNLDNILAAVAVGLYFDVPLAQIKRAIAQYIPQNKRSQKVNTSYNQVILDAYNANPTSMQLAIQNVISYNPEKVVLCLGAMYELGASSREEHEALIHFLQNYKWKEVFLVGIPFKGVQHNYKWFEKVEDLVGFLTQEIITDAVVLIKGSRSTEMDVLMEVL